MSNQTKPTQPKEENGLKVQDGVGGLYLARPEPWPSKGERAFEGYTPPRPLKFIDPHTPQKDFPSLDCRHSWIVGELRPFVHVLW